MIKGLKSFLLLPGLILFSLLANAQKKDSTFVGIIEGTVKDSVRNILLRSATVSVYKADGAQLMGYQLSSNIGKFRFQELPVGTKLNVMVSYVGYTPYKQEFVIPADTKKLDLKILYAERAENELEEVSIVSRRPPVEMKGDTLVFNADAFDVDSNATVEDLMRKLTGVTIWADGLITVNGKKINKLYVEGKPFFGGDPKIALQNLPKNVVDKVQVYEDKDSPDKLNPNVNMNIVLKKDKKSGLFGKIGGGYGTDKRYAADGMLSGYTPKTQLSIIGTHNNVNKVANSVTSLMANSSYKGEGTNYEYSSDFGRRGLNIFSSAGFTLSHDFSKPDRLNADYFFYNSKEDQLEKVLTVESLNDGNQLRRIGTGTSESNRSSHNFNSSYNHSSSKWDLSARYHLNATASNSINTQLSDVSNNATGASSSSAGRQENSGNQKSVDLDLKFENKDDYNARGKTSAPFSAGYIYKNSSGNDFSKRLTDFKASDPFLNKTFNREYNTDFNNSQHTINFKMPHIQPRELNLSGINMYFENTIDINNNKQTTAVGDLNGAGQYSPVNYLSNKTQYNTINEKPEIGISRNFSSYLTNRYQKNFTITVLSRGELFYQSNVSDKIFQEFNETYFRFLPAATLNYRHDKSGDFFRTYSLNYNTLAIYPNAYQIAPLTDSANVGFLHFGNPGLKPSYRQEVSFKFQHSDFGKGKSGMYSFSTYAGKVNGFIGDSSSYDALGRRIHYNINLEGHQFAGYQAHWQQAFKVKEHTLQLYFSSSLNYMHTPAFVNGDGLIQKNLTTSNLLQLNFTFKSMLTLSGSQSVSTGITRQNGDLNYSYTNYGTSAGTSLVWPKRLYWNTNVKFNRSLSVYADPINYTIWNASIAYRFLKGENAEVKFSALDLLGQNKSIINYGYNNSISTGTVNVLQQYFMFTLAYYPRFFGTLEKKK